MAKKIYVDKIPVTIEYRKVKNINLYIKAPNGHVLVTAPKYASVDRIRTFIAEKENWIMRKQAQVRERSKQEEGAEKAQEITETQLAHLEEKLKEYIGKWEPRMGVHATHWTLRRMKTRWGSCTVDTGRIRVNTRLVYYPDECLEYIVVHELCHLIEPSHNKRFHAYMAKFLPDWKERKKLLSNTWK